MVCYTVPSPCGYALSPPRVCFPFREQADHCSLLRHTQQLAVPTLVRYPGTLPPFSSTDPQSPRVALVFRWQN